MDLKDMSAYIWPGPHDDKIPGSWGSFDYKKSTFGQWLLRSIKPNEDYGEAIVNFKRWSVEKLLKWHCPPAIAATFVSPRLREVIRKFADEEELLFYPVTLICKDGINKDYQYLAPQHEVSCVDFDRSVPKIDSSIDSLGAISHRQTIYFRKNCLGNRHIAWEAHLPMYIVVSEALKQAVLELNDPGIEFVLPQNYRWI
jgi:hypothetical protein